MAEFASDVRLQAIVVGPPGGLDEFVQYAIGVAGLYGVEAVQCDDVYSAVVRVAQRAGSKGVVVGRLKELGREDGRFFEIAARSGFSCCCLAERDSLGRRQEVVAPVKAGAVVVTEAPEIEDALKELSRLRQAAEGGEEGRMKVRDVVEKILGTGGAGSQKGSRAAGFFRDEFLAAEPDALPGE